MTALIEIDTLSPAQQAFAEEVDARPLALPALITDAAFLYGRDTETPTRWLVDAAGRVLGRETFSAGRR